MIGEIVRHSWNSILDTALFLFWAAKLNQAECQRKINRRLIAAGSIWGLAGILSVVAAYPGENAGFRDWVLYVLLSLSLHAAAIFLFYAYAFDVRLWHRRQPDWQPGLTEHRRMMEQLDQLVNKKIPFTVILFHMHNLQDIKDLHGPDVGQSILDSLSVRIQERLPANARMSLSEGNLFWICVEGRTQDELLEWKYLTKSAWAKPWMVQSMPVYAEIASSLIPYRGGKEALASLVDRALDLLHPLHTEPLRTSPPTPESARRAKLTEDLRDALKQGQFCVHYQPQFDIRSGKVRGFEALLRWRHPEHGFVSPAEFIPLAEASGLIIPIGMWVLRQACETGNHLLNVFPDAVISVNVSGLQINDSHFPECVIDIVRSACFPLHQLELEVTETALMASLDFAQQQLMRLNQAGIMLALDDFGVGYSSLNYLKKLPFEVVKIDKSFTNDLTDPKEAKMTEAIIQLVKNLDYRVVAEGLETFDQLNRLKEMDCDVAQGYLLSKPLSPEQLPEFIAKHTVHP